VLVLVFSVSGRRPSDFGVLVLVISVSGWCPSDFGVLVLVISVSGWCPSDIFLILNPTPGKILEHQKPFCKKVSAVTDFQKLFIRALYYPIS
jgi:hypothetical protein